MQPEQTPWPSGHETISDVTDYEISKDLAAKLAAFEHAQADAAEAREALREAVADELRDYDVTGDVLAEYLPWSGETVRGIARQFGVPHKRKPTVRSIKPKRKA